MSTSTAVTEAVDAWLRRRLRLRDMQINETYAAVALTAATITALVWANVGHSYHSFWQTPASLAIGPFKVELSLHGWVDEGLMTAFFFMVGLDVRRDLTLGELRLPGRALLPVVSAIGGLVVPALAYSAITHGADGAHAWGSVISTDTAFALGMHVGGNFTGVLLDCLSREETLTGWSRFTAPSVIAMVTETLVTAAAVWFLGRPSSTSASHR